MLNLTQLNAIDLPIDSDKPSAFLQSSPVNTSWVEGATPVNPPPAE
jgi:hypothetical protein